MTPPASNRPSALFLHWGPGSHAAVERAWFGDSLPIRWWDQPRIALEGLFDAAEAELRRLSDEQGGAVGLVAHSFGGQLALELSFRAPERIRSIELLGSSEWTGRAFLNLARQLARRHPSGAPALEAAAAAGERKLDAAGFGTLAAAIAAVPDFMLHYWGPASVAARDRYLEALAHCPPPMDLGSFMEVMGAFVERTPRAGESPFRGPVRFLAGTHDPLVDLDRENAAWRARFPQLECATADCGHFVQFETPASLWYGRRR
jgi:pimeloyl-ACP methyl ester carboxylesterase